MRKLIFIFSVLLLAMTSCIDWGLKELPVYNEAEMTAFNLEHRFVTKNANGVEMMAVVTLSGNAVIDKVAGTITLSATIPAPTAIFTQAERRKVSLENIVAYGKLSPAAKIEPMDGAPVLGTPGNFTTERKYKVTAADGKTSKVWTIKVNPLPVINQYEGVYACTGKLYWDGTHYDGQGTLYNTSRTVYLSSFNGTTCLASHGASVWTNGYSLRLKVNADNSVTVTQHDSAGNEVGEMVPGAENKYDPVTKTFIINYRSKTDDPYIGLYSDIFVMK